MFGACQVLDERLAEPEPWAMPLVNLSSGDARGVGHASEGFALCLECFVGLSTCLTPSSCVAGWVK